MKHISIEQPREESDKKPDDLDTKQEETAPLYSIILNKYGKEIKTIDDISFRENFVILVLASTYNIQCRFGINKYF